jgi:hypothetical protein
MTKRIPMKGGDEYDGLTKARKFLLWKSGQLKKIKRAYNKRFRKHIKEVNDEVDAIKVTDIVDHEDGSATITLDMDPATYHKIFEQGFLKLIQRGIESENVDAR